MTKPRVLITLQHVPHLLLNLRSGCSKKAGLLSNGSLSLPPTVYALPNKSGSMLLGISSTMSHTWKIFSNISTLSSIPSLNSVIPWYSSFPHESPALMGVGKALLLSWERRKQVKKILSDVTTFSLPTSKGGRKWQRPPRQMRTWIAFHNSALATWKSRTDRFLKGQMRLNLKDTSVDWC